MLGTTFGGNHLACAAAIAVVEVMKDENLIQNASEQGAYLIDELKKFDRIKEVRGKGLIIGIELPEELNQVRKDLLFKDRIFTGEAKPNVIRLLPSLAISKESIDHFLESFSNRLKTF
jgi:acetylornithine aminotransferase